MGTQVSVGCFVSPCVLGRSSRAEVCGGCFGGLTCVPIKHVNEQNFLSSTCPQLITNSIQTVVAMGERAGLITVVRSLQPSSCFPNLQTARDELFLGFSVALGQSDHPSCLGSRSSALFGSCLTALCQGWGDGRRSRDVQIPFYS